uniref:PRELI/MSF1 domain-containing protein n=1 Tax=Angiostrongylus cantonensis TaxID=6313 RepID=A0A0K0D704_ANGCA
VKERFHERNESDTVVERHWDRSELDTAGAAEARKSFMQGSAFETAAIERSAKDLEELQFKRCWVTHSKMIDEHLKAKEFVVFPKKAV